MNTAPKERILLIPEGRNNDFTPCGWIRLIHPWTAFAKSNNHELHVGNWRDLDSFKPSVVVTQRTVAGEKASEFVSNARSRGVKTVIDLDDYLLELPKSHPDYMEYEVNRPYLEAALEQVDYITVSTESLAKKLDFAQKTILVPNALAPQIWVGSDSGHVEKSDSSEFINVLYAGTTSHRSDWAMVEDQVINSLKANKSLRVFLIGVTSEKVPKHRRLIRLNPPRAAIASYPAYVNWLRKVQEFDFGIAPLLNTDFNSYKSDLKLLEYTALGAVSFCSPVEPYLNTNIAPEMFNYVSESGWFEVLSDLSSSSTSPRNTANELSRFPELFINEKGVNQFGITRVFEE